MPSEIMDPINSKATCILQKKGMVMRPDTRTQNIIQQKQIVGSYQCAGEMRVSKASQGGCKQWLLKGQGEGWPAQGHHNRQIGGWTQD